MLFEITGVCKGGEYLWCHTVPLHPKAQNRVYHLHRVLMENKIGRLLENGEIVHHKDGNKLNNDIENLELLTHAEHSKLHHPVIPDVEELCAMCRNTFKLKPRVYRLRRKHNRNNRLFCSKSCYRRSTNKPHRDALS